MLLNHIKFAELISWFSYEFNIRLNEGQLSTVSGICKEINHASVSEPGSFSPDVVKRETINLIASICGDKGGVKKVEAIKAYRTLTGLGLKESKDAIESITFKMYNPELEFVKTKE